MWRAPSGESCETRSSQQPGNADQTAGRVRSSRKCTEEEVTATWLVLRRLDCKTRDHRFFPGSDHEVIVADSERRLPQLAEIGAVRRELTQGINRKFLAPSHF